MRSNLLVLRWILAWPGLPFYPQGSGDSVTHENSGIVLSISLQCLKSEEILLGKLQISRQYSKNTPIFTLSFHLSTPPLPTLWDCLQSSCAHGMSLSSEQMPATFYMWTYIFMSTVYRSLLYLGELPYVSVCICVSRSSLIGVFLCQKLYYILPAFHPQDGLLYITVCSGNIQAVQYWSEE